MHSESRQATAVWFAASLLLLVVIGMSLRYGTDVLERGPRLDERFGFAVMSEIMKGWTVERAIDFEETKGPALMWTYAILGKALGGELNDLRMVSVLFFILGGVPLLLMCGMCGIRGSTLLLVCALYALLPYHAVMSQLVMSESSFVFGGMWLLFVFFKGFAAGPDAVRYRWWCPAVFCVLLAILLHSRLHAVAYAGAACLVAFERDRWRSWPWWVASVLGGLLRVPLWLRWGGLVSPKYQSLHGVGLAGFDCSAYLMASFLSVLGVLLLLFLMTPAYRKRWWVVAGFAFVGLLWGIGATPDLSARLPLGDEQNIPRFLGLIATAIELATTNEHLQRALMIALTTLGFASLGALASFAWQRHEHSMRGAILRAQFWCITTGIGMYVLTSASVYDRYVLPWALLMPIIWVTVLPRWLIAVQAAALLFVVGWLTQAWL